MEDAGALVALKIRCLREQKGLSQEKLSFLADLHRVYIGQIERGEKRPTLLTLQKIDYSSEKKSSARWRRRRICRRLRIWRLRVV